VNGMSHGEVEQVLAAYVLGALTAEETRQVEAHLEGCAEHRAAARALRDTASRLALAVEEQEPPAGLRRRILDALGAAETGADTGANTQPFPPGSPEEVETAAGLARRPAIRWRRPRLGVLAAAAAVLLALGASFVAGTRIAQPPQQTWTFAGNALAPQAEANVVYDRNRHVAVIAATGLPALKPGQLYEVWLIRHGSPVDVGVSAGADGKAVVRSEKDVSQFDQLAITVEPGEQPKPTTDPVLVGSLS
jgi:anti-sigma-K factor RskA